MIDKKTQVFIDNDAGKARSSVRSIEEIKPFRSIDDKTKQVWWEKNKTRQVLFFLLLHWSDSTHFSFLIDDTRHFMTTIDMSFFFLINCNCLRMNALIHIENFSSLSRVDYWWEMANDQGYFSLTLTYCY